jgi:hypothetical protein
MKKIKEVTQVRQGDVILVSVDSIPKNATIDAKEKGRVVLAHGEVTGHAHVLDHPETLKYTKTPAGEHFITVVKHIAERALRHEEHGAVHLIGDKVQQGFQVEDFGAEVRRVAD